MPIVFMDMEKKKKIVARWILQVIVLFVAGSVVIRCILMIMLLEKQGL